MEALSYFAWFLVGWTMVDLARLVIRQATDRPLPKGLRYRVAIEGLILLILAIIGAW